MCETLAPQFVLPFATSADQYSGGSNYHEPAAGKRIKVQANIQYLNSVTERYIHTNLLDR